MDQRFVSKLAYHLSKVHPNKQAQVHQDFVKTFNLPNDGGGIVSDIKNWAKRLAGRVYQQTIGNKINAADAKKRAVQIVKNPAYSMVAASAPQSKALISRGGDVTTSADINPNGPDKDFYDQAMGQESQLQSEAARRYNQDETYARDEEAAARGINTDTTGADIGVAVGTSVMDAIPGIGPLLSFATNTAYGVGKSDKEAQQIGHFQRAADWSDQAAADEYAHNQAQQRQEDLLNEGKAAHNASVNADYRASLEHRKERMQAAEASGQQYHGGAVFGQGGKGIRNPIINNIASIMKPQNTTTGKTGVKGGALPLHEVHRAMERYSLRHHPELKDSAEGVIEARGHRFRTAELAKYRAANPGKASSIHAESSPWYKAIVGHVVSLNVPPDVQEELMDDIYARTLHTKHATREQLKGYRTGVDIKSLGADDPHYNPDKDPDITDKPEPSVTGERRRSLTPAPVMPAPASAPVPAPAPTLQDEPMQLSKAVNPGPTKTDPITKSQTYPVGVLKRPGVSASAKVDTRAQGSDVPGAVPSKIPDQQFKVDTGPAREKRVRSAELQKEIAALRSEINNVLGKKSVKIVDSKVRGDVQHDSIKPVGGDDPSDEDMNDPPPAQFKETTEAPKVIVPSVLKKARAAGGTIEEAEVKRSVDPLKTFASTTVDTAPALTQTQTGPTEGAPQEPIKENRKQIPGEIAGVNSGTFTAYNALPNPDPTAYGFDGGPLESVGETDKVRMNSTAKRQPFMRYIGISERLPVGLNPPASAVPEKCDTNFDFSKYYELRAKQRFFNGPVSAK